jgi:hypothetical protein
VSVLPLLTGDVVRRDVPTEHYSTLLYRSVVLVFLMCIEFNNTGEYDK